ncbi:VOC family protein [Ideonella azotifigens]|uniref:VOC family protein n=1 Tax=Ideonella azotifigens TaxID=513160 RepID=A0ABN1KEQ4_9BURK|nr:VOC family protein [Ideonella azotifigens]MCD2340717.1 VOC family protein [Ideonella azotifigens]
MPHPIAYLAFPGQCAEAMQFYAGVLQGSLKLLRNADLPADQRMPGFTADAVMHAALTLPGGGDLYAGDVPPGMPYEGVKGVSLTLNFDTVAEAQRTFEALAEGGRTTMALQPQFWARINGMLVDRFGVAWIVNGELNPM